MIRVQALVDAEHDHYQNLFYICPQEPLLFIFTHRHNEFREVSIHINPREGYIQELLEHSREWWKYKSEAYAKKKANQDTKYGTVEYLEQQFPNFSGMLSTLHNGELELSVTRDFETIRQVLTALQVAGFRFD